MTAACPCKNPLHCNGFFFLLITLWLLFQHPQKQLAYENKDPEQHYSAKFWGLRTGMALPLISFFCGLTNFLR